MLSCPQLRQIDAEIAATTADDASDADGADPQQPPSTTQTQPRPPPPPIEVVIALPDVDFSNPAFAELKRVYERFTTPQQPPSPPPTPSPLPTAPSTASSIDLDDSPSSPSSHSLSRRQLKEATRLSVAQLKQLTPSPSVVELHDVNSPDPALLVHLKALPNSVPVPVHWQAKRRYLSGKRGYEKLPFQLPDFIAQTGIAKIRGVQLEKEAAKKGKAKQREKMRPKMGAIDIDYQILHDAFFRYQTKPPLTPVGALYYEGREFEVKLTEKRPLAYSQALLDALGMPSPTSPPPWLYAMQRHGPPPSYPFLKVPGVNAALPAGGRWGLGDGEWGKPPIDEMGRPRWGGDLFGAPQDERKEVRVKGKHWGALASDDEAESEEEEDGEEERKRPLSPAAAASPPFPPSDLSGLASVPPLGLQTPSTLNLRKADGRGTETPTTVHPPAPAPPLFRVLEPKEVARGAGLLGTTHSYVIPNVDDEARRREGGGGGGGVVEVALGVEELEGLSGAVLKRKYEEAVGGEEGGSGVGGEEGATEVRVGSGPGEVPLAHTSKKRKTKDKDRDKDKDKFKF